MKRPLSLSAGLSILPLLLAAAPALAQIDPAPLDPTPVDSTPVAVAGGSELTSVLPGASQLVITAPLAIGLNSGAAGEPISIPLDVYWGLSDDFTLGITHSNGTIQGVAPYRAGNGVCLTKDDCFGQKIYNNIGFDALVRLVPGMLQLAGHGGIDLDSLDPSRIALRLGLLAKAPLGTNVAIVADPRFRIGLNERDLNPDGLTLPVAVQFQTLSGIRLSGMTGISGPLENFGDFFQGWLGAFAGLGFNEKIEGFASFTFDNLYGNNGGGDFRTLVLGANIRP